MKSAIAKQNANPKQGYTCASCGDMFSKQNFYTSYNPVHATGIIPYCKNCLGNMIKNVDGSISILKLKTTLELIDKPFIEELWQANIDKCGSSSPHSIFGNYIKLTQMNQYRNFRWRDSTNEAVQLSHKPNIKVEFDKSKKQEAFVLTEAIVEKWGMGYRPEEYQSFEKKHNMLRNNYVEKTAMHTEALLNYIRYRVKEELATAGGNTKDAKEWGNLAKDAAKDAKINPSQLSAADLADGLSTFSQLVRAVEQAVDIIPILPVFKKKPQDDVDFTIWQYINYGRHLKGLPECKYEDIYNFLEIRKQEYAINKRVGESLGDEGLDGEAAEDCSEEIDGDGDGNGSD